MSGNTLYEKYLALTKGRLLKDPAIRLRFNQGMARSSGAVPFYVSKDILFNPKDNRFVITAGDSIGGLVIGDNDLAFDVNDPLSKPLTYLTDLFSDVQNPTELEFTTASILHPEFLEMVESAYENVYLKKTLSGF